MHYNWHRFYDPATGRYISADPIGLAGGINLYAYVGANPVNLIDFTGLVARSRSDLLFGKCRPRKKRVTEEGECCLKKCAKEGLSGPSGAVSTQVMSSAGSAATRAGIRQGMSSGIVVVGGSKLLPVVGWASTAKSVLDGYNCYAKCGLLEYPCGNPEDYVVYPNGSIGLR